MLSPERIRALVMPGIRQLIEQAHSYDLKVIYHSCGAIADIIPDLIAAGADAIHPIEAKATGMQADRLKRDFGDRTAFCGGVDAQNLLVKGTPEEVRSKVIELCELFPNGLLISPSHEAVLPDIPPTNIEVLFQVASDSIKQKNKPHHQQTVNYKTYEFYTHRTAGCNCYHRDSGQHAAAGT